MADGVTVNYIRDLFNLHIVRGELHPHKFNSFPFPFDSGFHSGILGRQHLNHLRH